MSSNMDSLAIARAPKESLFGTSFNSRMLITAREARTLTQSDLAERLGVSQALVGKWEADLLTPGIDQIDGIALALGVQRELFFVDRPRRLASMSDFYHRALSKARRADVKAIHARCNIIDIQIDRLLQLAEPSPDTIPSIDPENHAGDIEKVAAMARVAMNVAPGPLPNLVSVIEACGGIVVDRELEVDDIDALCRWVPELPKLFFVNGAKPPDRIRFSLAHELGHTIMHFGRDRDLAVAEKEANAFASAFLMPAKDFRRDVRPDLGLADLAALKRKWRVSMQASAYRAKAVNGIDDRRYESLYVQMSRKGWRKTEPIEIAGESPQVFTRLLQRHLEAGYTKSDLAKLLFVSEPDIDTMLADAAAPTFAEHGVRMRMVRD
ncbi:ImmA/IrrE family metallo-endopeptidase [Humisphaera borealis]|uniref:ImmA/IrrE family metallo-endopeptidase n=1 Tax=Humisphaera borealis TaxID=2807512 RepID=A0A7M2WSS1_9BACT|nr:ImmA/IrrE family metallo-endopeptidase [Humisphaera borealis]QOV88548.1 ImmA/IrrE family metallo-endopeptidase [Humisphaera borealis]